MDKLTRFFIERKHTNVGWDIIAHPRNDLPEALELLLTLREKEKTKRYKRPLRLIKETREIIEVNDYGRHQ